MPILWACEKLQRPFADVQGQDGARKSLRQAVRNAPNQRVTVE